jgi:serine/threonine protein kinase
MQLDILSLTHNRETTKNHFPTTAIDLWSIGCVLVIMIISDRSFFGEDKSQSSILKKLSEERSDSQTIDFVRGLTEIDVKSRFKASEALKNDWFKS